MDRVSSNSGSSSQRPGGINPNPDTTCATCSRDDYYYDALNDFDPESSTHPYEQQACDTGAVDAETNSLRLTIGMGQAGFGRIGGNLELYAPEASPHLLEPGVLALSLAEGNETIRDADSGRVLQFVSAASIADVVEDPGGNGYTLKFYTREAGQADTRRDDNTGKFETTGKAYVQIQIFSPDGAPQAGADVHSIRVIRASATSAAGATDAAGTIGDEVVDYRYDAASKTWELTKDDGNQIEQVKTIQSDDLTCPTPKIEPHWMRPVRSKCISESNTDVSFAETRWCAKSSIPRARHGPPPGNTIPISTPPDPLAASSKSYGPDGNWHRYEYDRLGRTTKTVSQYLDAPVGAQEQLQSIRNPICRPRRQQGMLTTACARSISNASAVTKSVLRPIVRSNRSPLPRRAHGQHPNNTVTKKTLLHRRSVPRRSQEPSSDGTATFYKYSMAA